MANQYSTAFTPVTEKRSSPNRRLKTLHAEKSSAYRRLSLNNQLLLVCCLALGDAMVLAIAFCAFAFFAPFATYSPILGFPILGAIFVTLLGVAGYTLLWARQIRRAPATHATYNVALQTGNRLPLLILPMVFFLSTRGTTFTPLVLFMATACGGILAWRITAAHYINTATCTKFLQERIVLIGDHKDILQLLTKSQRRYTHTNIIGYYSLKQKSASTIEGSALEGIESLGVLADVAFLRSEHPVDAIVVVGSALDNAKQRLILRKLAAFSCPIYRCLVPLFAAASTSVVDKNKSLGTIFAPAHVALLRNRTLSLRDQYLKRAFDVITSSVALIALSPLLISAGIAVKLNSKGSIFFRQQRWGINGKVFHIYKFRSMYQDRCDTGQGNVVQAKKWDTRITPVGCILRSTSIDELPQLFNVLKGDMSLIGPRPHAVGHNEYYAPKIPLYVSRHRVKPGLSGLAQVYGYRGETPKLEQMHKRVSYDAAYIRQWSVWLDIQIAFRTLGLVLRRKNAY
jgi:putative colanic acid biosynthesis UDP-glucose lipid carrier transferase